MNKQFYIILFDALQHGVYDHREWLRDKIIKFAMNQGITLLVTDFTIHTN